MTSALAGRLALVGIGASAGGLEAATRFLEALPSGSGIAFILIQHLDPSHRSMMVELLAQHTAMQVHQAADGMAIEPEHLYVIAPGTILSVGRGVLHVSRPAARQDARMPFDLLLKSMAESYGERAGCVVLSGTGTDGSDGLLAIHAKGGLVVAQDPAEAAYAGMPRSAIATADVDFVLPVAQIPAALIDRRAPVTAGSPISRPVAQDPTKGVCLAKIIDLLRTRTTHDFTVYKRGTLRRRVERRMAMASFKSDDMAGYLTMLRDDREELDTLANDLLINVTSFFRDAKVFDQLAKKTIPELVKSHAGDRPLRIWIAGCSTGEETYSLAILFLEEIAAAKPTIKLQVFASDVDADAIAVAREGLYPLATQDSITPQRLARFFSREDSGWRASPDLRGSIVFTTQDVLTDPPFSRLDLVSCRNLLIYLQPDAQAHVIDRFHFALREGGILLLGSAETVVDTKSRFEVVSKTDRIYRRLGWVRMTKPDHHGVTALDQARSDGRLRPTGALGRMPSRRAALADLGRRLVIEAYAPATVLINASNETLFSIGPVERYLRLPPGHATHDLLALARPGLRAKLQSALQSARETGTKVQVAGRINSNHKGWSFNLEVSPVLEAGEEMLLVSFVDTPWTEPNGNRPASAGAVPRLHELERELEATRTELQGTVRDLELSGEEQRAINEEALSVNEEYQSTNEELVASKEELQSLNEELTALNSQLQETLESQRTTADDLQNVLYSTNVATLFLDRELRIRFFTPATTSLFAVIPSDVGRKLADFTALAPDDALEADARAVLVRLEPLEREIAAKDGVWFRRRILPYLASGDRVEGVVITFTDITARKNAASALEVAKKQAEVANAAKSRFLAAASHDLRQPLQTLALLQALLAKTVEGQQAKSLIWRLDDTVGAMAAMLDTLLDINEIEAGVVSPEVTPFAINGMLDRLRDEFTYHAQAKGLSLRVIPCGLHVVSDPRLLEQMIRNLISNALKYTMEGRVLLGCRRHGGLLSVEVWDTGIGIPEAEMESIFEEYHQIDNVARERSRGLGLGLSIVKRLSGLLGHPVRVRSHRGRGSGFTVEVALVPGADIRASQPLVDSDRQASCKNPAAILVVEDDPDLRDMLGQLLQADGHHVMMAADGPAALGLVAHRAPELVLADYNLPNGQNGLELAGSIRQAVGSEVPVVILTGDISTETLREVARNGYAQLNKPVKLADLEQTIDRLLAAVPAPARTEPVADAGSPVVFVVDDDTSVRHAITAILEDRGHTVAAYDSGEAFLRAFRPGKEACLLVDAYLPGMNGTDLIERLRADGHSLPAIMITGQSDVPMAVRAMKAGASDFIEKPVGRSDLLASVGRALERAHDSTKLSAWHDDAARHVAGLTSRQRQVMTLVLAGQPSKNIAADLGISQRTVENHRASVMRKTGTNSLPALARLALAAAAE